MLWALLFACSPHSPSKEGAEQFPGDPPSGYPGKSPLRKVLSPAHITPTPREADGGCGSLPFSLFPQTQRAAGRGPASVRDSVKDGTPTPARAHDFTLWERPLHWQLVLSLPAFLGFLTWSEKSIYNIGLIWDLSWKTHNLPSSFKRTKRAGQAPCSWGHRAGSPEAVIVLGSGWAVALTSDPEMHTLFVARRQARRKNQVFKAINVSRPGLWLGMFSTLSSDGTLIFRDRKSWSRGWGRKPVFLGTCWGQTWEVGELWGCAQEV